jgi:hypothetical protein
MMGTGLRALLPGHLPKHGAPLARPAYVATTEAYHTEKKTRGGAQKLNYLCKDTVTSARSTTSRNDHEMCSEHWLRHNYI